MKKILLSIVFIFVAAVSLRMYYPYAVKRISNEVSEIKHANIVAAGKTLEFDYPVFKDWNVKVYNNRVEYRPKPILGMIPVFQPASRIEIDAVDYSVGYPEGDEWYLVNDFGVGYGWGKNFIHLDFENGYTFSQSISSYPSEASLDYEKVLKTIAGSFHEVK